MEDKFGSVEVIEMSDEQQNPVVQYKSEFRGLVITFLLNWKFKSLKLQLSSKSDGFEFNEFDDFMIYKNSINIVTETYEDIIRIIKS